RALEDVQISLGRFREICEKHELDDDAISALANLMNDLGDVVYFSDAEGLKETMILNPEWLTKAIGYVLEDQQTNAGAGLLAWNRLHEIWSSDRPDREDYPRDKHPFFLRLMEQFDISFRLGDSTSLVGQLVPASEPEEVQPWKDAAQSDDLVLVCRLSADAPGLISWLIVRTHWYSQNIHWQSGMLLNHAPHGEALIELVGRNLQITVRATYPTYFADILKDTVDFLISDRWPGLTSQWAVPCTKDDCSGLSNLSVLKTRQTKKESDVSCPECGEDLQIDQLLLWVPSDDLDVDLEVSTVQGIEAVGSDDLKKSLPTHAAWIMRCVRKTAPKNMRFFSCRAIDESTWAYRAWCDAPGCEHPRDLIDGSGRGIIHSHPPSHFFRHDEAEQLSEVLRIRTTYPDQDMPQQLLPLTVGTDQEFESMRTWGTESEKPVAQKPPQKEKSEPGDTVRSVGFVLGAGRLLSQLEFISRTPMWGLNRYVGPDGQQLHLCEFHHSKFDPGLPEIPETAEETTTLPVVRPFSLKSVRIKNFRGIESLEVPLAAESDLDGTWCCLAGINGAGKTAILEAIALAMIGPDAVMEIGGGRLARMIRQDPEIKDAEITLKVSRGTDESTTLYMALSRRSEGNAIVNRELIEHNASSDAERVREELQRHLFVSYGATRNLSDNEESIQVDVSPIVERQWTLFQPLSHIPGINVIFGNNKKNSARVKVIRAFIRKLFDVGSLEVSETQDDLSLVFKQGGSDVDSFQLPDGYRSTIGWLADLCSEWHRLDREAAEANHFEKMAGVVLIDEIDLHLHPSLQRSLVPKLRRLLPHVQFIVTTHSPMVLASFDQNELVLLEQNGGKLGIRNVDRQIFGFSMNQIYRWLLDTSSHSPVIDELIAAGEDEEVVRHLYLSTDEEELVAEERFLKQQASLRNLRERGPQE
ncbi:MAG: putative ATP-binding protein involved in virulence, partial [Planctomycetaceae bacterium]